MIMGGKATKLKQKKETVGVLEETKILPRGQLHPLLIPHIAEKIFSNLGGKDLLSVRRVCVEWHTLATETYRNRREIEKTLTLDQVSIQGFIDLMSRSSRIPVVRWFFLNIYLDALALQALIQFLSFVASFVKSLKFGFGPCASGRNRYLLADLRHKSLQMPELIDLVVRESRRGGGADVVKKFTCMILQGADSLRSFLADFPLEPRSGDHFRALPRGLQQLEFGSLCRYEGDPRDGLYPGLMNFGLQIQEVQDTTDLFDLDPGPLVEFLSAQKDSLVRVDIEKLEEVYKLTYPSFPSFKGVHNLTFDVNWNSTFEFLNHFPNVVKLTVHPKKLNYRLERMKDTGTHLHQHQSVRKLNLFYRGYVTDGLINYPVLGHCFPNVTHLSAPIGGRDGGITDVFNHFPNIEWLHLHQTYDEMIPRCWESLWSGIPRDVYDAMNASGNYTQTVEAYGPGLTDLRRLRTLELGDATFCFNYKLFTELMVHRVLARMESLKEICFVQAKDIPRVRQQ